MEMDRLRKISGINVDNVDKKVDNFYGKPGECRKYQYFSILLIKMLSDYVNSLMHKKIHILWGKSMWKIWWIMWITLHAKEVFPDFIYISGPHSYQHVSVDTIF